MLLILLAVRVLTRTETFQDDLFSNQQTYTFVLWVCCYYTTQKLLKMGERVIRHHFYDTIRIRMSKSLKQG